MVQEKQVLNTAALAFGGETPGTGNVANNESWNGTSWTELNDLNTARMHYQVAGTNTAALAFGGSGPVDHRCNRILEWYKLDNKSK
jgi:hypothetical protein